MDKLKDEEKDYVDNSISSWYIKVYLNEGFSLQRSIIRGMEEHIEELYGIIHKLENDQPTIIEKKE